jgi:predicted RNase H-like HicB family nuclease
MADYLALSYPLRLIPDPDGGYVFEYPDLAGCLGQIDDLSELAETAEDVRQLWLTTAWELGKQIPLPSAPEEYSGKFVVRVPKSLHRRLAEAAGTEGVSLNYLVGSILATGQVAIGLSHRIDNLCDKVDALRDDVKVSYGGFPRQLPSTRGVLADDLALAA